MASPFPLRPATASTVQPLRATRRLTRPVGVLALQGDFAAHRRALEAAGAPTVELRDPAEMYELAAVVLPGGESTTMLRLLAHRGMTEALRARIAAGLPTLATCAGVILLAREVLAPAQPSLGLLDVTVERNAYGRQLASAVDECTVTAGAGLGRERIEGVFIRAPRVTRVGAGVTVLAWRHGDPVLLRQGGILAATFHPELTPSDPVVPAFVRGLEDQP